MDRSQLLAKIQASSKKLILWGGVALGGVILLTVIVRSGPTVWTKAGQAGAAVVEYLSIRELFEIYGQAFISVQKKVDGLKRAEDYARTLAMENARLRLERETADFDCSSRIAESSTRKFETKLKQKTGLAVGRIPESISYRAPENVPPSQLLTLARAYFRDREDEKAAVLLTTVTEMDGPRFQSAEVRLMTGIAWYRLDHLELANSYLDQVLSKATTPDVLRYQAQARLWKALAATKSGKKMKAQYWLRELVDNHPHAREAAWVNSLSSDSLPHSKSRGATRVPASKH